MNEKTNTNIIEIYKLFVSTSLKITENRQKVNTFFITLNTAVVGSQNFFSSPILLCFCILINILWSKLIKSCQQLNAAKFKVICDMEKQLGYECFTKEQEEYEKKSRKNFTSLENMLPLIINIMYICHLAMTYKNDIIAYISACLR